MKLPFTLLFFGIFAFTPGLWATALDDYVAAPDSSFSYSLANTVSGIGYNATIWEVTSQTWRSSSEVDRPLWKHWLLVIVPNTVSHTKAMMYIGGGSNHDTVPGDVSFSLLQAALGTNSIVAEIRMIPNQPLKFTDEIDSRYLSSGRTEDQMIAYAWDKYKKSLEANMEDPEWLPRLPMTKAVVRAMDIVQAEYPSVDGFFVSGASKRGWTTWTTAAVDPRVEAICPQVIDVLNVDDSMRHHYWAYGYWADAVGDYVDTGIMDWMDTPYMDAMLDIVDPYSYRQRLTLPKYIVNSAGDQFFLPDSWKFYFDDLVGEKHLRYVPNTDHGLNNEALLNILTYYHSFLNGIPRPDYNWTLEEDGTFRVETSTTPSKVLLWHALNPTERNFRLDTVGNAWAAYQLTEQGGGVYVGKETIPAVGYVAYFIELEYPSGGPFPFKFTTGVNVLPKELPFEPVPSLSVDSWDLYR